MYEEDEGAANSAKLILFNPVSNNDPLVESADLRRESLKFDQFDVVSGMPIAFTFNITDQNWNVLVNENTATAQIHVTETAPGKIASLSGNYALAQNGVLNFTGMTIIGDPGYPLKL